MTDVCDVFSIRNGVVLTVILLVQCYFYNPSTISLFLQILCGYSDVDNESACYVPPINGKNRIRNEENDK